MTRLNASNRKTALENKRQQIEAQLKAIAAREKETARKEDTRRKVIAGALALEHMDKNPHSPFAGIMHDLLTNYVEPRSRYLFPFCRPSSRPRKALARPLPRLQPIRRLGQLARLLRRFLCLPLLCLTSQSMNPLRRRRPRQLRRSWKHAGQTGKARRSRWLAGLNRTRLRCRVTRRKVINLRDREAAPGSPGYSRNKAR